MTATKTFKGIVFMTAESNEFSLMDGNMTGEIAEEVEGTPEEIIAQHEAEGGSKVVRHWEKGGYLFLALEA